MANADNLSRRLELADNPEEVIKGLRAWKNPGNGLISVLLHFSADPDGADEETRRAGLPIEDFKREHALSFSSFAGKPVYSEFSDEHVDGGVFPSNEHVIWRGWDFGYHRPACLFVQVHGGLWALGEVQGEDMTLDKFVKQVEAYQERVFGPDAKYLDAADIAGKQVTDKSEYTSFAILANYGVFPYAKKTEINEGLTIIRQKIHDKSFKVHPRCRILIEGLKGGYRYPESTPGTPEPQFPLKDGFYDHLQDALRYIAVSNFHLRLPKPAKPKPPSAAPFVERVLARRNRSRQDKTFGDFG